MDGEIHHEDSSEEAYSPYRMHDRTELFNEHTGFLSQDGSDLTASMKENSARGVSAPLFTV